LSKYIIKQNSKNKINRAKYSKISKGDLFFIYYRDSGRIAGLYKKISKTSLCRIKPYRRELDGNDLNYNNIILKWGTSSIIKINNTRFNKILSLLEMKNYSQTAPDYLFFKIYHNKLNMEYIQNHPAVLSINKSSTVDINIIKSLINLIEKCMVKIVNFPEDNTELDKISWRVTNIFFKELNFIFTLSSRFIILKTDNFLSKIPFEFFLFKNKQDFYIGRLIEIDYKETPYPVNYHDSIKFIYPDYPSLFIKN